MIREASQKESCNDEESWKQWEFQPAPSTNASLQSPVRIKSLLDVMSGSPGSSSSSNPRKFSEKIALHNQKQAEETRAFEQLMTDLTVSRVSTTVSRNLVTYLSGLGERIEVCFVVVCHDELGYCCVQRKSIQRFSGQFLFVFTLTEWVKTSWTTLFNQSHENKKD